MIFDYQVKDKRAKFQNKCVKKRRLWQEVICWGGYLSKEVWVESYKEEKESRK